MTENQDISSDEMHILNHIPKKREITETLLTREIEERKMDVSILHKLDNLGLILYIPKTGGQKVGRYQLTPKGSVITQKPTPKTTQKLLVKSTKRAKKEKKPSRPTIASLKQEMDSKFQQQQNILESILQRFNTIEKKLGIIDSTSSIKVASEEIEPQKMLKKVYDNIRSSEPRLTNLIPLSMLKPMLYEKHNLSDEVIDQTLLKLEKQRTIDLQVAYDAGSLKGAEYGIKIPGRGLVFYVRWR